MTPGESILPALKLPDPSEQYILTSTPKHIAFKLWKGWRA